MTRTTSQDRVVVSASEEGRGLTGLCIEVAEFVKSDEFKSHGLSEKSAVFEHVGDTLRVTFYVDLKVKKARELLALIDAWGDAYAVAHWQNDQGTGKAVDDANAEARLRYDVLLTALGLETS